MNLQQLVIIFWARKLLIAAYLLVTMITTLFLSLAMSKHYMANASLVLEQEAINPVTGAEIRTELLTSYMATQTDIIKSPAVALAVADILGLENDKATQEAYQKSNKDSDFRDWLAKYLNKNLDVIPSRESSILGISYSATDPEFAAKAANAFAQAYIQVANQLKHQPAKQTADWFDDRLRMLQDKVKEARDKLSNYQQTQGIVAPSSERIDLEDAKLAELSSQLVKNQLQTEELLSKKAQVLKGLSGSESLKLLPDVINDKVFQELQVVFARSEAKFADISIHFDKNHPQYRQAAAEIANFKKQLTDQAKIVLSGLNGNILSSKLRDESLTKAVEKQKQIILQLKKQYDDIAVLTREVVNAQTAYDTVMQRSIQVRMESEIRQSNIAILDHATVSKIPSSPKIKINMMISFLLGIILGVCAALIAEIIDRRVRSPIDITDALDLSFFGSISASDAPKKFSWSFGVRS